MLKFDHWVWRRVEFDKTYWNIKKKDENFIGWTKGERMFDYIQHNHPPTVDGPYDFNTVTPRGYTKSIIPMPFSYD